MIPNRKWLITKIALALAVLLIPMAVLYGGLNLWWGPLIAGTAAWLASWGFVHAKTTCIPEKSFAYVDGRIYRVFPTKVWMWNRSFFWLLNNSTDPAGEIMSYAQQTAHLQLSASSGILCYIVIVRAESPQAVLETQLLLNRSKDWKTFEKFGDYLGYELVRTCATRLNDFSDLYNPLDEAQQTTYFECLRLCLKDFLEDRGFPTEQGLMYPGMGSHFELSSKPHQWVMMKR